MSKLDAKMNKIGIRNEVIDNIQFSESIYNFFKIKFKFESCKRSTKLFKKKSTDDSFPSNTKINFY